MLDGDTGLVLGIQVWFILEEQPAGPNSKSVDEAFQRGGTEKKKR